MRVYTLVPIVKALRFLVFLSLSLLPTASIASTLHPSTAYISHGAWFVGVGGGASWINLPKSTSVMNGAIVLPPYNQDRFSINNLSTGIAQVDAGYVLSIARTFFPALSAYVQYRHYFANNISGNIEQYSLPAFNNYNYTMSYEADLFTINSKVNLIRLNQLLPYLSGGIGFIINHLNDYRESAKPNVTPRVSPAYQGYSNTKLAVTLGAGLDFLINDSATVTLGYDHVFQGNINSGSGAGTWSSTTLNIGNTKMDTIFINITANFAQT